MSDKAQQLDVPAARAGPATAFHVDIISDVMCPWCYIGKRCFERMATAHRDYSFQVAWRPFQLDPTLPAQGLARSEYLARKFGGPEAVEAVYGPIRAAGAGENIAFEFERIAVSPNTLNAHRLIAWAHEQGAANRIVEALFGAYFTQGRNIGVVEVLADIARECELDGAQILTRLNSDEDLEKIRQAANKARAMGVTGVPTFIIDKHYVVEGAQSPENLARVFRRIADSYGTA